MPVVLEQPRMLHSLVSALPAAAGVAVLTLTRLLRAPPDQPNLPAAICNVVRCMEAVQLRAPQATGILASLTKELSVAAQALTGLLELHQPAGMIGRVSAHRAWALCTSSLNEVPTALLEAIGLEISRAYLCEDVFSANLAKKFYQAHQQLLNDSSHQDNLDKLENYVLSQCKCMQPIFSDQIKGLDAKTASFNNQVVASINSQTSSLRIEERQASGRIFEMSPSELTHVAIELKHQMEAGDARALQIALGFCIGLPWELALKVPFVFGTQCSAVAWINPGDKCVYVNLADVLPALSKKRTVRHIPTALLLIRPLPLIVGNLVFEACAANPGLETVEDLAHESDQISRSTLPGAPTETAIRSSVARFIASRGGAALHAGVSRDTAAYTTLSLHLISKSDHHYLVKQRSDIWRGCDAVSSALNWGPCVPDTNVEGTAFGSRVTPQLNWVKEITDELRSAADLLRAGKRYSFDSLARHHNTYAAYVGLLMTILVGGRNRSRVEFCASTWGG